MTWSIDPPQARGVLSTVLGHVSGVDSAAEKTASAVEQATAATQLAPSTSAALAVIASDPLLMGIAATRRYVEEVVSVVDSVIGVYEQRDLEMAAQTEAQIPGEPR